MAKRKEIRHIQGTFGACTHLAFTPDGRTLVAAHADATVLLWDVTDRLASKAP
jgi:WD40 repeat protein